MELVVHLLATFHQFVAKQREIEVKEGKLLFTWIYYWHINQINTAVDSLITQVEV